MFAAVPFLVGGLSLPPGDAVPTLRASQTSGVAPMGIVFDGVQTTHPTLDPYHELLYFFDFGDGSAGTYTYGALAGKSLNLALGAPLAAHVYTASGSYTASMWVWDGTGLAGPVTQAITVTNADTVYSGTNTVVVSTSGTFTGKPTGATEVTSSDLAAVFAAHAGATKRILFRGGETFTRSTSTSLPSGCTDLFIGSFGTGKAILQGSGNNAQLIPSPVSGPVQRARVTNIRLESGGFTEVFGISLLSTGRPAAPTSGNGGGVLVPGDLIGYHTIHDVEMSGIGGGVYPYGRGNVVSKLAFANCNNGVAVNGPVGIYGGDLYQIGIIDSQIDMNYGGEHAIRFDGGQLLAVEGLHIKRLPGSRNSLTFRSGQNYATEYCVARGCFFDGSEAGALAGTMTHVGNANAAFPWTRPKDIVFERNYIRAHDLAANAIAVAEAHRVSIRSNGVYYSSSYAQGGNNMDVFGVSYSSTSTPKTLAAQDVWIYNNSLYNDSVKSPRFVSVYNAVAEAAGVTATTASVDIGGNVGYSPNSGGGTISLESLTSGTVSPWGTISNNSSAAQMRSTSPNFTTVPPTGMVSFVPTVGSYAINGGADFKTFIDGLEQLRLSGGNYDAGAVNSAAKNTDAWTLVP